MKLDAALDTERLKLRPVRASVDAGNGPSRALLEALGFAVVDASPGRLGEVLV